MASRLFFLEMPETLEEYQAEQLSAEMEGAMKNAGINARVVVLHGGCRLIEVKADGSEIEMGRSGEEEDCR